MRRLFYSLTMLSMIGVLSLSFTGCTEDDDNPITPIDDVVAPTQLQAYSDDGAVGLSWSPSTSEIESNFGQYRIQVVEVAATDTSDYVIDAGNGAIINGLTNGIIYNFRVFAEDTDGKLSDNYVEIRWAPAVRQYSDQNNNEIEVYATTSATKPSGIDIYNASGKAEVISQAGAAFAERGDLYVHAESGTSTSLIIRAADNATNNPGPTTFFSTVPAEEADNLNDVVQSSAPSNSTYTAKEISIGTGPTGIGRMYWGRIENRPVPGTGDTGDFYFRVLVREMNGTLVQGNGDERYLVLEFSYQTMPDVPYAKRVN